MITEHKGNSNKFEFSMKKIHLITHLSFFSMHEESQETENRYVNSLLIFIPPTSKVRQRLGG